MVPLQTISTVLVLIQCSNVLVSLAAPATELEPVRPSYSVCYGSTCWPENLVGGDPDNLLPVSKDWTDTRLPTGTSLVLVARTVCLDSEVHPRCLRALCSESPYGGSLFLHHLPLLSAVPGICLVKLGNRHLVYEKWESNAPQSYPQVSCAVEFEVLL